MVDVLPKRSGKDGALIYLAAKLSLRLAEVVFAGDSGNDIEALVCGVKGILVANAQVPVRHELRELLKEKHLEQQVYFSKRKYVAGVIEGLIYHGFI